jgi:hypothetical protein
MSRLYDRVMENGCMPISVQDVARFLNFDETRARLAEKMSVQLRREPSPEEVDAALVTALRGQAPTTGLDKASLVGLPLIVGDDVAAYTETLPSG